MEKSKIRYVLTKMKLTVSETQLLHRDVWNYRKADWVRLKDELREHDWSFLQTDDPNSGALKFTDILRGYCLECIGKRQIREAKSTHPWMTEEIVDMVAKKHAAEGTAQENEARDRCSEKMAQTKAEYVQRTKESLKDMKEGSKQWWKTSSELLGAPSKICNIPALKDMDGNWVKDPGPKADLLAKNFQENI